MNSSFGNDPKIMKQLGVDKAYMHPDEVKSRGLADGARVRISNPTGEMTLRLAASVDVPMGVILVHKSCWTTNDCVANVNALNPGSKADLRRAAPFTALTCR